ncbi:aldose 1-epimerase [Paenibacillus soyae]|uniref:Aldose 1-epimerase n=1 Tax=Paenibacillus soyae TaxID=2969249 RepID=A0A9X2MR74_9BACL|nr:aldose 1-epimerase [Paenibacillus soyae]MCR2804782.1 aldose 1-epimerase [Paenibacillus soyae]
MNPYEVICKVQDGYSVVELRDTERGDCAQLVPEIGGNLIRFHSSGRELLAAPGSIHDLRGNEFMYGTPLLFPPNRVQGGSFTFKGRPYQLPINEQPDRHLHGELARKSWEAVEWRGTEEQGAYVVLRFRYSDHEDMLAYFPHPLVFNVTISLLGGRLRLDGVIVNEGEDEAPFAFGLHPYFNLPGGQALLQAPAVKEWPISTFTFIEGVPANTERAGELREGLSLDRIAPLGSAMVELQEGEERVCRLRMIEEGYTIAYSIGNTFPYLLIFRPNWSESICLEPYSCLTDAFNLPYPPEMTGASGIAPGERVTFETCMWVEESS